MDSPQYWEVGCGPLLLNNSLYLSNTPAAFYSFSFWWVKNGHKYFDAPSMKRKCLYPLLLKLCVLILLCSIAYGRRQPAIVSGSVLRNELVSFVFFCLFVCLFVFCTILSGSCQQPHTKSDNPETIMTERPWVNMSADNPRGSQPSSLLHQSARHVNEATLSPLERSTH